jgi:tetratricopeptide (TPR) repeat protein
MSVSKLTSTCLIIAALIVPGFSFADSGGSSSKSSPLNPVHKLIEDKNYRKAIFELGKADQNDADVMNLLGYSNRKLKNYDAALKYYQLALSINPKHKDANEYLGELYLETSQLDKAKERLAVLDDVCFFSCSEYKTLKRAIEEYEKKTAN